MKHASLTQNTHEERTKGFNLPHDAITAIEETNGEEIRSANEKANLSMLQTSQMSVQQHEKATEVFSGLHTRLCKIRFSLCPNEQSTCVARSLNEKRTRQEPHLLTL